MIANREFVRQQIFADRGSKFYTSAADNTLDALEDMKPVKFQLIEVTKYGCHIRALVDDKAYHLTKSSVRWIDVPHYFKHWSEIDRTSRQKMPTTIEVTE